MRIDQPVIQRTEPKSLNAYKIRPVFAVSVIPEVAGRAATALLNRARKVTALQTAGEASGRAPALRRSAERRFFDAVLHPVRTEPTPIWSAELASE